MEVIRLISISHRQIYKHLYARLKKPKNRIQNQNKNGHRHPNFPTRVPIQHALLLVPENLLEMVL